MNKLSFFTALQAADCYLSYNETTNKLELIAADGTTVLMIFETHGSRHSYGGADPLAAASIKASQIKYQKLASTGTGAEQTLAHTLGVVPALVLFTATASAADPRLGATAATATNVYAVAETGKTYDVYVIA
jgi:ABC-type histidine transport system ATPase subunit